MKVDTQTILSCKCGEWKVDEDYHKREIPADVFIEILAPCPKCYFSCAYRFYSFTRIISK